MKTIKQLSYFYLFRAIVKFDKFLEQQKTMFVSAENRLKAPEFPKNRTIAQ